MTSLKQSLDGLICVFILKKKTIKNLRAMKLDFQQCGMCDQQRLRSVCAYAQSDQSLCWSLGYSMTVKLLTEHHLEVLSLREGCTGSSESTLVKMSHCWKSHVPGSNINLNFTNSQDIYLSNFLSMRKIMTNMQMAAMLTYVCTLCSLFRSTK